MYRRAIMTALVTGAIAVVAVGCAQAPRPRPPSAAGSPPTTAAASGRVASGHGSSASGTSPSTDSRPPRCDAAALQPVVAKALDDPSVRFTVERVEVAACRNGYARVFAIPRAVDPPVEADQLFLRFADGAWRVIARGPSIDCGDAGLSAALAAACRALA